MDEASPNTSEAPKPARANTAAKAELSLLAHLIVLPMPASGRDMFVMDNLFGERWDKGCVQLEVCCSVDSLVCRMQPNSGMSVSTITIDASQSNKSKKLVDIMDEFSFAEQTTNQNTTQTSSAFDLLGD